MKKTVLALGFVSTISLTSCTVTEGVYTPAYNNDYVYSVGYYGYRPYWSSGYNSGYGWGTGNTGYWRGYRSYYSGYRTYHRGDYRNYDYRHYRYSSHR